MVKLTMMIEFDEDYKLGDMLLVDGWKERRREGIQVSSRLQERVEKGVMDRETERGREKNW